MNCRSLFALSTIAAFVFGFESVGSAQTVTDTETFRVTVNSKLSITAPTALITQLHDETDNDQVFSAQDWAIVCNSSAGATATFATNQVFTNQSDNSYKRDVTLALTKTSGSAAWAVTTASDTTDYAGLDETASVAAASAVAGSANFDLTVTFIEETFSDLAEGDYEMTVTGTLTAN